MPIRPQKNIATPKLVHSPLPRVVLLGRANVGKSTLFNKIVGRLSALIDDKAGTTRDRNTAAVEWQGRSFIIIDTGGITAPKFLPAKNKRPADCGAADSIERASQEQARIAMTEADCVIFVVDAKTGLLQADRELALLLKRISGKPVLLAVNKVDTPSRRLQTAEFHKLALGEPLLISAATGAGIGDLLDATTANLPAETQADEIKPAVNIAIIGRPNVGKSSLLNALVGAERVIVNEQPHTTREPQDTLLTYNDKILRIVDTAGIVRAKSKSSNDQLIKRGIQMSLSALKKADVALLVIDATAGVTHQETKLAEEITTREAGVIIVINKWDAVAEKDMKYWQRYVDSKLPWLVWAPKMFVSAKNRTKVRQLLDTALTVAQARASELTVAQLTDFLASAQRHAAPLAATKVRGQMRQHIKKPKLLGLRQTGTEPPVFTLDIRGKFGIKDNYIKYLENRLRDTFKLVGAPVRVAVNIKQGIIK